MTGSQWTYAQSMIEGRAPPALPAEWSTAQLVDAEAENRVELELSRSPDRCDTRIARACGTNVMIVRQVRERLGAYPTRPV